MDDLRKKLAADKVVLGDVVRRGVCWYQRSMAHGTKLGDPVLVIITSKKVGLCAEGLCIHEDGTTHGLNVYAEDVLSKPVTSSDVEARIKLAVQHFDQDLRRTCRHVLPQVLPGVVRKRRGVHAA